MKEFAGKTVVVTGAGSGIGAAVARELASASVVAADIDVEAAAAMAKEIESDGGTALPVRVDVADPSSVEQMVDFASGSFGGLQLAVNNAGIGGPQASIADYPLDDWRRVIDVNLNGVFYGMKYQIAAMLRSGGGAIVNMASILAAVGWANASPYVAAKHALLGLTRTAALEYATLNIRINAVGPAFIDTPLLSKDHDAEILGQLAALHPVARLGKPEEVSALTCFLLSDKASFINGSYHLVDGGYTSR